MARLSSAVAIMMHPTGSRQLSLQAAVNSAAGSFVTSASRNHLPNYGVWEGEGCGSYLYAEVSAAVHYKDGNGTKVYPKIAL